MAGGGLKLWASIAAGASTLFGKVKNLFKGGGAGGAGGHGGGLGGMMPPAGGGAPKGPGIIRNFVNNGQFIGSGRLLRLARWLIVMVVLLALAGILVLTVGTQSGQGIATSIKNGLGSLFGTVQEGSELYLEQYQLATGQRYAAEVDDYAAEDVGVTVSEVNPTQATYSVNDPVTLWGIIDVKTIKADDPITVHVGCRNEKESLDYNHEDIVENGRITPNGGVYTVYDTEAIDFKCDFQEGILDNEWSTTNKFIVTTDFDFSTMAYVSLNFMDENAYRALENNDPERIAELSAVPVSKNTQGPLELGIGTNKNPVLVYNSSIQSKSYMGISFTNIANGYIQNLTRLDVLIPRGVELVDCDAAIAFDENEPADSEMNDYFTNYTLLPESLEYLSSLLSEDSFAGSESRYLSQSLRCFLEFKPEEIFADRSRLDPVKLNVFAFADYDYRIEDTTSIAVERENFGASTQVTPRIIGVNSEFECKAVRTTGNEFTKGTFTLSYRKQGEDAVVVDGYNAIPALCAGESCVATINVPSLPIASELSVGDYLICKFTIDRENDDEQVTATKLVKILNTPPQLEDLSFEPQGTPAHQDLTCIADVLDEEQDVLEDIKFKFRVFGQQYIRDGTCDEYDESDHALCQATLEHSLFSAGNVVSCSVYVFDGTDSNDDEGNIETEITEPPEGSVTEAETRECTDTDGGLDYYTRGTTTGVNAAGEPVSLQDTCSNPTLLREYRCDTENYVSSLEFECSCSNGVCYS